MSTKTTDMSLAPRDIREVRMSKSKVLRILRENRDRHRGLFEEAMDAYRAEAIHQLEAHVERIKAGRPEKVYVSLTMPEDHTDDYDVVISMLDNGLDAEVVMDEHDYRTFVLDQWGWQSTFAQTYSLYTGKEL